MTHVDIWCGWQALLCCLFLVAGFILGVDQEGETGELTVRG